MVRGLSQAVRGIAKQSRKKKKDEEEEDEEWKSMPASGPRSFPLDVKEMCWQKAETVKGRDPSRWRRDPVGNLVFRKLVGCSGCLCYDYDHVLPYSKGGTSTLDNCQVLQAAANRAKGNRKDISKSELAQKSVYCRLSGRHGFDGNDCLWECPSRVGGLQYTMSCQFQLCCLRILHCANRQNMVGMFRLAV